MIQNTYYSRELSQSTYRNQYSEVSKRSPTSPEESIRQIVNKKQEIRNEAKENSNNISIKDIQRQVMNEIKKIIEAQKNQIEPTKKPTTSKPVGESSELSAAESIKKTINELLTPDAQGNINEEELQFAVIAHILGEKSPELQEAFLAQFEAAISNPDLIQVEDATKLALEAMANSGQLDQVDAEKIYDLSFQLAQIDNNREALFDSNGSENDPTRAVINIEEAGSIVESNLTYIQNNPSQVQANSNADYNHQSVNGMQYPGFLWKPESERNGNLVVLLPQELTGKVTEAGIYSSLPPSSENLIENGEFSGDRHNGGRAHFRFDKPGKKYPNNSYVVAKLENGTTVSFQIANGAKRTES